MDSHQNQTTTDRTQRASIPVISTPSNPARCFPQKIQDSFQDFILQKETSYYSIWSATRRVDTQTYSLRVLDKDSECYKNDMDSTITLFIQEMFYLGKKLNNIIIEDICYQNGLLTFVTKDDHLLFQGEQSRQEAEKPNINKLLENVLEDLEILKQIWRAPLSKIESTLICSNKDNYVIADWQSCVPPLVDPHAKKLNSLQKEGLFNSCKDVFFGIFRNYGVEEEELEFLKNENTQTHAYHLEKILNTERFNLSEEIKQKLKSGLKAKDKEESAIERTNNLKENALVNTNGDPRESRGIEVNFPEEEKKTANTNRKKKSKVIIIEENNSSHNEDTHSTKTSQQQSFLVQPTFISNTEFPNINLSHESNNSVKPKTDSQREFSSLIYLNEKGENLTQPKNENPVAIMTHIRADDNQQNLVDSGVIAWDETHSDSPISQVNETGEDLTQPMNENPVAITTPIRTDDNQQNLVASEVIASNKTRPDSPISQVNETGEDLTQPMNENSAAIMTPIRSDDNQQNQGDSEVNPWKKTHPESQAEENIINLENTRKNAYNLIWSLYGTNEIGVYDRMKKSTKTVQGITINKNEGNRN